MAFSGPLPVELMDKIVKYTSCNLVSRALTGHISSSLSEKMDRTVLIYGTVQGGKTKEIVNCLKNKEFKDEIKVLVIQNSLLVLEQYKQRLEKEKINFQVVTKNTTKLTCKVILILGNSFRYRYFLSMEPERYVLLLDEADLTLKNCPLKKAYKTFHITATPFSSQPIVYDRIIKLKEDPNYYGLTKLNVEQYTINSVEEFSSTKKGMLLINNIVYVNDMKIHALELSAKYPSIPVILLTSVKTLYLNHIPIEIAKKHSISKIIDSLHRFNHVIFIANRLSNRGLSYVSSDFSRHLTHQISKVGGNITNFIQKLRILGIYKDNVKPKLIVDNLERFEKYLNFVEGFSTDILLE